MRNVHKVVDTETASGRGSTRRAGAQLPVALQLRGGSVVLLLALQPRPQQLRAPPQPRSRVLCQAHANSTVSCHGVLHKMSKHAAATGCRAYTGKDVTAAHNDISRFLVL